MKPLLSRAQETYRALRFIRQRLSWQELRTLAKNTKISNDLISPADSNGTERTLVLAPHPDDEAFGCGGALAYHAQHGDSITVVYVHAGDAGNANGVPDATLAVKREKEANATVELLHAQAEFWRIPDGRKVNDQQNQEKLIELINRINPTKIYTPWLSDNHPDHMDTAKLLAATLALDSGIKAEVWQYEIWSPLVPNYFLPIRQVVQAKTTLMNSYVSQLNTSAYFDGITGLNAYRGLQAMVNGPAEAFFVLSAAQFVKLAR